MTRNPFVVAVNTDDPTVGDDAADLVADAVSAVAPHVTLEGIDVEDVDLAGRALRIRRTGAWTFAVGASGADADADPAPPERDGRVLDVEMLVYAADIFCLAWARHRAA